MKNLVITILTAAILTTNGAYASTFSSDFGEGVTLLIYRPLIDIVSSDGVSPRGLQVPGFGLSR